MIAGEPVRFLGLPGKGPNTEDPPELLGCGFPRESQDTYLASHPVCVECHRKSRGPEAELKPMNAHFPLLTFRALLTALSQNRYNEFVFCLCNSILATK